MIFANAGHPPLLIKRRDGLVEAITERETMLGIHERLVFTNATTRMEPGETALLFTDGLYSLVDPNRKRMEESAVRLAFRNVGTEDGLLGRLCGELKAAAGGSPFTDDVAAVSIHRVR